MTPAVCPLCGAPIAQVLATTVDCTSPQCRNYSARSAAAAPAKRIAIWEIRGNGRLCLDEEIITTVDEPDLTLWGGLTAYCRRRGYTHLYTYRSTIYGMQPLEPYYFKFMPENPIEIDKLDQLGRAELGAQWDP